MVTRRISRIVLHSVFAVLVTWWFFIWIRQSTGTENYYFNLLMSLAGLYGGGLALCNIWSWRRDYRTYSYGFLAFALAVLFQSIGALIFSYYNFSNISEVPYPGIADLFYGAFPLFAISGTLLLTWSIWFNSEDDNFARMLLHTVGPFVIVAVSIFAFITIAQVRPLDLQSAASPASFALDLYYNIGDSLTLAIGFVMLVSLRSYKKLGVNKAVLAIICGFVTIYCADFLFFYRFNQGLYFIGDFPDIFYVATLYFVSLGGILFSPHPLLTVGPSGGTTS